MYALTLMAALLVPGQKVEADVVLRGATLFDGSGKAGVVGDLAIKGERIVGVGTFEVAGTPRILDCTGLYITPGFIDLHTHSDTQLQNAKTRQNLNYLTQGVTTVVTGNCGFGPVDVGTYFKMMDAGGVGTNVIHQVPHGSLREKVMGNVNRAPTPDELKKMESLVDQGMRDGAWGMATGLIYTPGSFARTDELVDLSKVVAKHGGFYASHIRDEGTGVLVAIAEILEIARKAGLRVHISHIKVSGRRAWGKGPEVIALIRRGREEGIHVTADQYPYTASSTSLAATVIPSKYREGSAKAQLERLEDPKIQKAIEDALGGRQGGKTIRIARFAPHTEWQGKDLAAIAAAEKKAPLEIVLDIQRRGGASVVNFGMNEEEVRLFMQEDYVATASDGSSQVKDSSVPHPRSYGTFPRKIGRYAIEDKLVPVEKAIRSASGLPADILKLPERGYLKSGYVADVVVFDPKTYRDIATYDQPHQHATGVRYLFINGREAIRDGRPTDVLAGRVLRHQ